MYAKRICTWLKSREQAKGIQSTLTVKISVLRWKARMLLVIQESKISSTMDDFHILPQLSNILTKKCIYKTVLFSTKPQMGQPQMKKKPTTTSFQAMNLKHHFEWN